jgi:hypothetical protein
MKFWVHLYEITSCEHDLELLAKDYEIHLSKRDAIFVPENYTITLACNLLSPVFHDHVDVIVQINTHIWFVFQEYDFCIDNPYKITGFHCAAPESSSNRVVHHQAMGL